ncbi:MAG: hypothetical protein ACLPZY_20210 [Terracidiphilus sp.]
MKATVYFTALLVAALPMAIIAQAPASPLAVPVPTIKVLAIGHLTGTMTPDQRRTIMPSEVADTVRLYLDGKIDQWYTRQDQPGVVFLLNVPSTDEANALLSALPLGKAKLMEFELIPLGPLNPLRILLNQQSVAPKQP